MDVKKAKETARKRLMNTPLRQVTERFGSKENLVKELKTLFDKSDVFVKKLSEATDLAGVSNAKLLRLHALATELKEKFGSRKDLVDKYVAMVGKADAAALKEKLAAQPIGKLMDLYRAAEKKAKGALKKGAKE